LGRVGRVKALECAPAFTTGQKRQDYLRWALGRIIKGFVKKARQLAAVLSDF
jgi:hypothetical protein